MGKIIEFNRRKDNETEGVRLYFQCFKTLSKSEQRKAEDMIKDTLFKGVMKKLTNEQILEIYGYAANKLKQDREIAKFNEKMRTLLEKYEYEVFENV